MQELEKILEEIENARNEYPKACFPWYVNGMRDAENIIRKHMNDGWIPSKKHLPEVPKMGDKYPEFNAMIEGAKIPTTLNYSNEGIWFDDYGNVYNVIDGSRFRRRTDRSLRKKSRTGDRIC